MLLMFAYLFVSSSDIVIIVVCTIFLWHLSLHFLLWDMRQRFWRREGMLVTSIFVGWYRCWRMGENWLTALFLQFSREKMFSRNTWCWTRIDVDSVTNLTLSGYISLKKKCKSHKHNEFCANFLQTNKNRNSVVKNVEYLSVLRYVAENNITRQGNLEFAVFLKLKYVSEFQ